MTVEANENVEDYAPLMKMREEFPEHQIGLLPKPYSKDSQKGNCKECGGYHGLPALHLDFVGHAALTDRLLDADLRWSWRPFAVDADGLPRFDKNGGLWMYLTVGGVERIGYGDSGGKSGANAVKEAIGDALRNSGMRFGAALNLWHKGDLHDAEVERGTSPVQADAVAPVPATAVASKPVKQSPADKARADLKALCAKPENNWDLAAVAAKFASAVSENGDPKPDLRTASASAVKAFMVSLESGVITV